MPSAVIWLVASSILCLRRDHFFIYADRQRSGAHFYLYRRGDRRFGYYFTSGGGHGVAEAIIGVVSV